MALIVLHSPEEWKAEWKARFGAASRTVLSVGNFDGLHLGHQKILQSVRDRASATSQQAAVITFDPHPLRVLRPDRAPRMIQTLAQRLAGFERMGLDAALILRFDRELSLVSGEDFACSRRTESHPCLKRLSDHHFAARRWPYTGLPPKTIDYH